jgi:hypothetical protein
LPAPGPALALAEHLTLPVFLPLSVPKEATPWTILSWGSTLLHGISRSLCPRPHDQGHLSWGFLPLQRTRRRKSTVRPVAQPDLPVLPGFCQRVPPHWLRYRSQVFPTSQRFLPSFTVLPFSGRWRSWGSPYRDLLLSRSPGSSSRRHALLTLLLLVALPPT